MPVAHTSLTYLSLILAYGINGTDIIPQLHQRWPAMNILVYTAYQQEYMTIKTLAAGANGYVLKAVVSKFC